MIINKKTFTVFLVITIIVAIQGLRLYRSHSMIPGASDQKSKGDPRAPIRIVEYTDFQCPACAVGASHLQEFFKKYPGKIFIQYRAFPLTSMHERAMIMAIAGECAARQKKFWPYHDLLFQRAKLLTKTLRTNGKLVEMAQELGMDPGLFDKCLRDPATELFVIGEKNKAQELGVKATPTYFINGKMVVGAKSCQEEIQRLLGVAVATSKEQQDSGARRDMSRAGAVATSKEQQDSGTRRDMSRAGAVATSKEQQDSDPQRDMSRAGGMTKEPKP